MKKTFPFAGLKYAAGAALKNAAPAPTNKKIGSGAALKVAAPCGSATLNTGANYIFFCSRKPMKSYQLGNTALLAKELL